MEHQKVCSCQTTLVSQGRVILALAGSHSPQCVRAELTNKEALHKAHM